MASMGPTATRIRRLTYIGDEKIGDTVSLIGPWDDGA